MRFLIWINKLYQWVAVIFLIAVFSLIAVMEFWNTIWTGEPLQWVIIWGFLIACGLESWITYQYWTQDCGTIETYINYLKNNQTSPSLDKHFNWLKEHIDGKINPQQKSFQPRKLDEGGFVLLQYPAVLARAVPRSSLRFVPTLCTALGLLGTFYGIQKGLHGINPGITESKQLLDASTALFAGMRTAFSNSLLGLGSGSLFTLIMAGCDAIRQRRRNKLRKDLNAIATLKTPLENLSNLDFSANNQATDALTIAVQTMTKTFTPNTLGQAIGQHISAAFEQAIDKKLTPVFKNIRDDVSFLREIQLNQGQQVQEVIENVMQNLRIQVIEPLVVRLDESANITREVAQSVNKLNEELAGVSTSLADSIQTIQEFQGDTLSKMEGFAERLQEILSQFQTDTKGVLETVAQEINHGVAQSIDGLESQRTAFEQSANQASATFRGIREDLESALHTQAETEEKMLKSVHNRMVDIMKRAYTAFQQQSTTLQTVGTEASILMKEAKTQLLEGLAEINGMLQNTKENTEQELEQFRLNYQTSLQQFFEQQNNLLEDTLGTQREGLAEIVSNLKSVFSEEAERRRTLNQSMDKIQESMDKIKETVEVVNKLASAVGLNSEQQRLRLKELVRDLSNEVHLVEQQYDNYNNKLEQILQKWSDNVINSQTRFFTEADNAMARVSGGLLEAANVLVAAENNRRLGNGRTDHD